MTSNDVGLSSPATIDTRLGHNNKSNANENKADATMKKILFLITMIVRSGLLTQALQKNLIIDTDLYSDVDDTGALLLAATLPDVSLLAVNVNYPSSFSALAASAILAHYGLDKVPIGISRPLNNGTFFDAWFYELGEYASKIAHGWSGGSLPWGHAEDARDPVDLYRDTLAGSKDGSVTIVSIGFLDNISGLLNSSGDSRSELSGRDLIACKVSELVIMGGYYPGPGYEWNFRGSNPAFAAHVINTWEDKIPIVFVGFELGLDVLSGGSLIAEGPASDPVRKAYMYYSLLDPRPSWDPLAVLYAARGLGNIFEYGNEFGKNHVFENGSNHWVWDKEITSQHFLRLKVSNCTAAEELDTLFLRGARSAVCPGFRAGQS